MDNRRQTFPLSNHIVTGERRDGGVCGLKIRARMRLKVLNVSWGQKSLGVRILSVRTLF